MDSCEACRRAIRKVESSGTRTKLVSAEGELGRRQSTLQREVDSAGESKFI
jgi:hypothetical protein